MYFLGVARYAHSDFFEGVIGDIFNQYADPFNATYERADSGVKMLDEKAFRSIVKDVEGMISERIKAAALPPSNFLKNAMLVSIFEPDVLVQVLQCLQEQQ
jgi:hypothetical protein